MKATLFITLCLFSSFSFAKNTMKRKPSNTNVEAQVLFNCKIQFLRVAQKEVSGTLNCSSKPFQKTRDIDYQGFITRDPDFKNVVVAAKFNDQAFDVTGIVQEEEETKRLLITEIHIPKAD